MRWKTVLMAWKQLIKPRPEYYVLNFYRGNTWEIAILKLEPEESRKELHGPVLTEKEYIPDIAQIPKIKSPDGIACDGIKRPCELALVEAMKNHLKGIKPHLAETIENF